MSVNIDREKCCLKDGVCTGCSCGCDTGTPKCVQVCAMGALAKGNVIEVDAAKCIDCGACISMCPNSAISF